MTSDTLYQLLQTHCGDIIKYYYIKEKENKMNLIFVHLCICNKKNLFLYIYIMYLKKISITCLRIVINIYWYIIRRNTFIYTSLSLCIYELCELPNLSHFIKCHFSFLRNIFLTRRTSGLMTQYNAYSKSFSDQFSVIIFQKIRHRISFLYSDDSKHFRSVIWHVIFLKDHLEFAHTYRVIPFKSREYDYLYATVYRV